MNSMPSNFLEIFWPSGAEIAIGYFLGLFILGHGINLLAANNSLINELKNYEKIFSDTYIPHKSAPRTTKPHTHTFWIRMGLQHFDQNESCRH